jgi:hypothetical protein
MGAVSDVLIEFCEAVFPDSFEDQDLLQEVIMAADPDTQAEPAATIEEYRERVKAIGWKALAEKPQLLPRTNLGEIATLLQGKDYNADIPY